MQEVTYLDRLALYAVLNDVVEIYETTKTMLAVVGTLYVSKLFLGCSWKIIQGFRRYFIPRYSLFRCTTLSNVLSKSCFAK